MRSKATPWSLSRKPFFGKLDRARAELEGLVDPPRITHRQFMEWLRDHEPELFEGVERAVFHDWHDGLDWRVAALNTEPRPSIRNGLFEARSRITRGTGWYPLVQGCAPIPPTRLQRPLGSADFGDLALGRLTSVTCRAGDPVTGTAFSLDGDRGSIALDLGFAGGEWLRDCRAGFLSHFHRDHAGGLGTFLRLCSGPLLLSEPTLALIRVAYPWARRQLDERARIVEGGLSYGTRGGIITVFPVHHTPGSLGFAYDDGSNCVAYTGDLCLRNGFCDHEKELVDSLDAISSGRTTVLVDTAAVGFGARTEAPTPASTIASIRDSLASGPVFVIAPDSSACLHLYLAAYREFLGRNRRPPILVPSETYEQIKALAAMRRRDRGFPRDAVLSAARDLNHILETQQLYPLTPEVWSELPNGVPILVLSDPRTLEAVPSEALLKRSRTLVTGRLVNKDLSILRRAGVQAERVDGAEWSFHSDVPDLTAFCRRLQQNGHRLAVFHADERRMRRFAADGGLTLDSLAFMRTGFSASL